MFLIDASLCSMGDEGGQAICKALLKNRTLEVLDIGSNELGEPTAALLSKVNIKYFCGFLQCAKKHLHLSYHL